MTKKKPFNKAHVFLGAAVVVPMLVFSGSSILSYATSVSYETEEFAAKNKTGETEKKETAREKVAHVKKPDAVKAIYMTACVLSTVEFKQDVVSVIDDTEVNSLVIDIKDFSGTISFPTNNPALQVGVNGTGCKATGVKEFIEELHAKGIYVIGRITVFQDPLYTAAHPELAVKRASDGAVWKDHKGLAFIEVGAKPYWDYIIELANESYALGFDEINFDYVRFPSDGNMKDIYFPFSDGKEKKEALREFFQYLDSKMRPDIEKEDRLITSVDIFGMTTTNTDDLNIGQYLEYALPYFDYVAPMVYPSHYPNGFNGWSNPNDHPYDLIKFVMSAGVDRVEALKNSTSTPQDIRDRVHVQQLRTWIQDFDYGGDYGPEEVRDQIRASYDAGLKSWMIWSPSNRYTRGALLSE